MGKYEKKNTTLSILFITILIAISCLTFMETSNAAGDAYISNSNNTIKNITADTTTDTVHMSSGTYNGIGNRNIEINRNISFIGQNGTIIDAGRNGRVFTVSEGSKLKLSNLTIMNGYSTNGAAIYIKNGGYLELENCNFISNLAGDGSAIYNDNGFLEFSNCVFTNNKATAGKTIASIGGTIIGNLQNGGGTNSYIGNTEQFNTKLYLNTSFKNNKIYLSIYAYDLYNKAPIVGETITFLINNAYTAAVTNSKGIANLVYVPTSSGLYKVTATIDSSGIKNGTNYVYLRSSVNESINAKLSKNSENSNDNRTDINIEVSTKGDKVFVLVKDNNDNPLSNIGLLVKNKKIDRTVGFFVTDSKGVITFSYKGDKSQLKLSFDGNDIYKPFEFSLTNIGNKGQNSNEAKATENQPTSASGKTSGKYNYGVNNSTNSDNNSSNVSVSKSKAGIPIAILFVLVLLSIITLRKKY